MATETSSPLDAALGKLRAEIDEGRGLLNRLQVHGDHYLLEFALMSYLRNGIASAEVVELAAKAQHPEGTEPITRSLFETSLDLLYLLTGPNPDEDAARTLVADLQEWEREWTLHEKASTPDLPAMTRQAGADETFEAFAAQLDAVGCDTAALRRLYAAAKGKGRPPHWSGLTRSDVITELERRGSDAAPMLRAMWAHMSGEAHASVGWVTLAAAVQPDGTLHVPDTAVSEDAEVIRVVEAACSLLAIVHHCVARYYETKPTPAQV
jgi:hypothetical protein